MDGEKARSKHPPLPWSNIPTNSIKNTKYKPVTEEEIEHDYQLFLKWPKNSPGHPEVLQK